MCSLSQRKCRVHWRRICLGGQSIVYKNTLVAVLMLRSWWSGEHPWALPTMFSPQDLYTLILQRHAPIVVFFSSFQFPAHSHDQECFCRSDAFHAKTHYHMYSIPLKYLHHISYLMVGSLPRSSGKLELRTGHLKPDTTIYSTFQ